MQLHHMHNIFTGLAIIVWLSLTPSASGETLNYAYDSMGRLLLADDGHSVTLAYSYDLLGNRRMQVAHTGAAPPNTPPFAPSAPSVPDDATEVPLTPVLTWTGGDPDVGDTVVYEVAFGKAGSPEWVTTGGQPRYAPDALVPDTAYCWQITAWDRQNASTAGPVWCFTTVSDTPPAPPPPPTPTPEVPEPTPTPDGGTPAPVPEPGTLMLLGIGVAALLRLMRRRE